MTGEDLEIVREVFSENAASYLATLGIALVCSYLGLLTVLRRIVFTGVALAQLAAAGVAGAFFVGGLSVVPEAWHSGITRYGATAGSLSASLLGVLGLRPGKGRVSPDARVGMIYAASGAIAILLVWRSPQGLAELRNILAGEVLLAQTGELVSMWIGLIGVAVVHALYRKQFLLVSYDPEFARALGLPEHRLQLMFLSTLAVAVALALKTGGLLLVFSFLVLPGVTGLVLGGTLKDATWIGAAAALGASLLGFLTAIAANLPVAPTVSACLLVLAGVAWAGSKHPRAQRAVRGLFAFLAVAALVAVVPAFAGKRDAPEPAPTPPPAHDHAEHAHEHEPSETEKELERLHSDDPEIRRAAAQRLEALRDPAALGSLIQTFNEDEDTDVCGACFDAIRKIAEHPEALESLERILHSPEPDIRVHGALTLLRLGRQDGLRVLVDALSDPEVPPFVKCEAYDGLLPISGDGFGFDAFADENDAALASWERWWTETGSKLRWDAKAKQYRR